MSDQDQKAMMIKALRTHALNLGPDPQYDWMYHGRPPESVAPIAQVNRIGPGLDYSQMPLSTNIDDRRWDPNLTGDDVPPWSAILGNTVNNLRSYLPIEGADVEGSVQTMQAQQAMQEMAKRLGQYQYNDKVGPREPQYHDQDTMSGKIRRQIPWGQIMQ